MHPASALVSIFEADRLIEDHRLRRLEHVRISAYDPPSTRRWEIERINKRIESLKAWTEKWWRHHGYVVVWGEIIDPLKLPEADVVPSQ